LNSNQSIPIGAIVEISPKGFTLRVKVEKDNIFKNLPLLWPLLGPKVEGYLSSWETNSQFATLEGNVVAIRYCCFDEIHLVDQSKP
jgi:hypothetical protein